MTLLILASLAFLLTHLGISSTPLRGVIVDAVGEQPYLGIYSLVSFITLGLMIYAFNQASHTDFLWTPGEPERLFSIVLMPVALIFVVGGLMVKNPTSVQQDAAVREELGGMIKVVRHPVQWGILLWAVAHVVANGDVASMVFFGTFAALAAVGMLAMDAKRRALDDPDWNRFYASTSYFPLVAILTGRAKLGFADLNWVAVGIGVVLYALVFVFHDWVSGIALI